MDKNEIMTAEEVMEVTEEVATAGFGRTFKVTAGIGLAVLVGGIAYKYIVKPMVAKAMTKQEQPEMVVEVVTDIEGADLMEESEE